MQRIFRFDMYLPLCLCGSEEKPEELWYHSSLHRKLKLLHENDLARGSDDLKLLFFYLRQERRVSAAAGLLNMHRNSVIYRINRIEEILDMDLDDEDTRGLLSFAAVPAMLYGFDKIRPHRYAGK